MNLLSLFRNRIKVVWCTHLHTRSSFVMDVVYQSNCNLYTLDYFIIWYGLNTSWFSVVVLVRGIQDNADMVCALSYGSSLDYKQLI
ncbi:hypothetical protein RIF29_28796 [Crotalaria pallida]|uniref:Uncharacterized protein n=1 Tax=Crotalaria pallida TaxID=3830 RepID=A0AAN9EDF5_CROPI